MNRLDSGSVWRKWDLHLHSPASFDYKSKGLSFQELANALNASDIDCLAITDHWTVDGFFQLQPLINKDKLCLAGIELRIDKTSKQKGLDGSGVLQSIVIFPEGITREEIEKKFLHQINLCEEKGKFITREDLIEIGKTRASQGATAEDCYLIGCQQAYVDYKQVVEKAHEIGALVCLTYDKYGGFESVDPVKDSIFKSDLVKNCDLMEVSKEEVQRSFYEQKQIIEACGKKTPCFNGSDAHELSEIGRGGIWIKSEKSFRGLKQIIYFPKERVSFSKQKPTYSYPRIKSFSLSNHKDGHPLSTLKQSIELNDNLNAVIGHPSIGKSTFSESMAYLFDVHTTTEPGEEKTKIENMLDANPQLKLTAEVLTGNVTSTISRDLAGTYEGTITKDEFKFSYLHQGYIDRTARDPKTVSRLIEEKMENPELESKWLDIEKLKQQLNGLRQKYLQRFNLLESKKSIESNVAKTKKFFEVSDSPEYKALVARNGTLQEKEKKLISAEQELNDIYGSLLKYEEVLSTLPDSLQKIETLFPSIASTLPKITVVTFASKLKDVIDALPGSVEKKQIATEKQQLATDTRILLGKEGIHFSEEVIRQQRENQSTFEGQLSNIEAQIAECAEALDLHKGITELLEQNYADWHEVDELAISEFNSGLDSVSIQYESPDKKAWLINVLTYEAKDAWDLYTPQSEKDIQKFIRPNQEDIEKILKRISEENKIAEDQLVAYLLQCIEKEEMPIQSDLESVKWLFGNKSEVIKSFLKLRLKEFAEKGEHQIYYGGKNISKVGMSFTERCGALLEILLQKGTEPILLDQPEENLGSSYVTKKLINKLLAKKFERQIILVSHNPNTVVLADSDQVVVFNKDGKSDDIAIKLGSIETDGMRETICEIMEGGKEAFDLRAERYKS